MTLRGIDPATVTEDELDRIDAMLTRAYRMPTRRARMQRFLDLQPDGWVVAEQDDQLVGTGGCIAYPDGGFGWIGLVATEPSFQGRGVGRLVTQHLVERLARHGCKSALDGSAMGAPVYERMGFADHGRTTALVVPERALLAEAEPAAVEPLHDIDEIRDFDRERFGADRSRLLAHIARAFPGRARIARNRGGQMLGYALAQEDLIGPVVADDTGVATALVSVASRLPWATRPRLLVPPGSAHLDAMLAIGCTEERVLRHQRLDLPMLPGRRESICAQTSFGEG